MMLGKKFTKKELRVNEVILFRSLRLMEARLAKHKFLCGDEVSIADLSAAHELDSSIMFGEDLTKWPLVKDWLHRMIDENPINLKIATPFRELAAQFRAEPKL